MWRRLVAQVVVIAAVGLSPLFSPLSSSQAVMAQDTATPTAPALVITVILVPASATPTPTATETPTVTPGPSETPTPTPSSTPQSALVLEQRNDTTGEAVGGSITFTITGGEFMIAVLLFAILCVQVFSWVLKRRGR